MHLVEISAGRTFGSIVVYLAIPIGIGFVGLKNEFAPSIHDGYVEFSESRGRNAKFIVVSIFGARSKDVRQVNIEIVIDFYAEGIVAFWVVLICRNEANKPAARCNIIFTNIAFGIGGVLTESFWE